MKRIVAKSLVDAGGVQFFHTGTCSIMGVDIFMKDGCA